MSNTKGSSLLTTGLYEQGQNKKAIDYYWWHPGYVVDWALGKNNEGRRDFRK